MRCQLCGAKFSNIFKLELIGTSEHDGISYRVCYNCLTKFLADYKTKQGAVKR